MANLSQLSHRLTSSRAPREPLLVTTPSATSSSYIVNADKVPLQDFSPEAAIDIWWGDKTQRPTSGPRTQYKRRTPQTPATRSSDTESSEEEDGEEVDKLILDDWDEWMHDVSDSD